MSFNKIDPMPSSPAAISTTSTKRKNLANESTDLAKVIRVETINEIAKKALTKASSYLNFLNVNSIHYSKEVVVKEIVNISKEISEIRSDLLKKNISANILAESLENTRAALFSKLPDYRVTPSDSTTPIFVPAIIIDKILTIRMLVQNTSSQDIAYPSVTRADLSLAIDFLNGKQEIHKANWKRFYKLASSLGIPIIEKACLSFIDFTMHPRTLEGRTPAKKIFDEANSFLTTLNSSTAKYVTESEATKIINFSESIYKITRDLLNEQDEPSKTLIKDLENIRAALFSKLPSFKISTVDSVVSIDVPANIIDKIQTIRLMIQDVKIGGDIYLPHISTEDLCLVTGFLEGKETISNINWRKLCNLALFLDIPELQKSCTSFAVENLKMNDIITMELPDSEFTQILRTLPADYVSSLLVQYFKSKKTVKDTLPDWAKKNPHIILKNANQNDINLLKPIAKYIIKLNISTCVDIITIPEAFVNLKQLNASFSGLTQDGFNVLGKNMPNLETLTITGCFSINSSLSKISTLKELIDVHTGLQIIKKYIHKLPILHLDGKFAAELPAYFREIAVFKN